LNVDEERHLIALCQGGDAAAYAGLVKAHAERVFAVCLGLLGHRQDAEDAAQQALLRGLMQIRNLNKIDSFGPWIVEIARNLCLDVLRRRKRQAPAPRDGRPDENGTPEDYRYLEAALHKLSSDYRVPLLLFYFNGQSTTSIARTLGLSQGAVQARLSRARKHLRSLLAKEGED